METCSECGSPDFHDEDGASVCANGHLQAGGLRIAEGDEEFGNQGKTTRKKEEKTRVSISKVFRGKKAYALFLQTYQFILWKQCYAMVHEKGLPSELWTVVRDLWTLRLSKLRHRVEETGKAFQENQSSSHRSTGESAEEIGREENEKETAVDTAARNPNLDETVALCYMGILLLRLPISLSTIFRWVQEEDIVYIRAIKHVPSDMKAKLPGEYFPSLDTLHLLEKDALQVAVLSLMRTYYASFGMGFPPINSTIILFQYIKQLNLPLEVYQASKSLVTLVKFNFKHDLIRKRRKAISFPEAQLMSLVVVAVKLLYPFDWNGNTCHPRSLNEDGAQIFDWQAWADSRTGTKASTNENGGLRKGQALGLRDVDIFNLSEKQLDEYMDWYQKMWTRTEGFGDNLNNELLEMFPLKLLPSPENALDDGHLEEEEVQKKVRMAQSSLKIRRIVSDEEAEEKGEQISRPGTQYIQYRTAGDLDLHTHAKPFYDTAAEIACLSTDTLIQAVIQTERRIAIWRKAKRRANFFGEEINLDAEAGFSSDWHALENFELEDDTFGEGFSEAAGEDVEDSDLNMIG